MKRFMWTSDAIAPACSKANAVSVSQFVPGARSTSTRTLLIFPLPPKRPLPGFLEVGDSFVQYTLSILSVDFQDPGTGYFTNSSESHIAQCFLELIFVLGCNFNQETAVCLGKQDEIISVYGCIKGDITQVNCGSQSTGKGHLGECHSNTAFTAVVTRPDQSFLQLQS